MAGKRRPSTEVERTINNLVQRNCKGCGWRPIEDFDLAGIYHQSRCKSCSKARRTENSRAKKGTVVATV